ncbi:hypothetical protein BVC80_1543g312 [Macleaya cordata]|uniref:Uncharacterized protein n=1 Tax=Macleaya cordata TaxID=56857 RepID=A0A200R2E9_MACCD|nr:hypothetical protein BVC80_1543g312 [Macleaya cordata]
MKMCKGLRRYYWSRKQGYERLDGSGFRRKNGRVELAKFGSSSSSSDRQNNKKRCWRIKITPKLKLFFKRNTPKKILTRLRDAYVNMMLGFANSSVFNSGFGGAIGGGGGGGGFAASVGGGYSFGKPVLKEYDEKVIVEFYKSLMAQGRLLPRDAARIVDGDGGGGGGGMVLCRRPLP